MKKLLKIISNFFTCGVEGGYENEDIRKIVTVNLFAFLGALSSFAITITSFLQGFVTYASIMFIYFVLIFSLMVFLRKTRKVLIAGYWGVIMVMIVEIGIFLYGIPTQGTAIQWFYIFPPLAFFVLGRIRGGLFVLFLFVLMIYFFKNPISTMYPYPQIFIQRFSIAFVAAIGFAYVFEFVREKTYNSFIESRQKQAYYLSETLQQKEEIQTQNEHILQQHADLENANMLLVQKNQHITDSINYAKNIQNAILPQKLEEFSEHFIIYRPKDIVSGDFYWTSQPEQYNFVAVIDCTGHGVPGAFMSMIGNRLLNQIVNEQKQYEPNLILQQLDTEIKKALRQDKTENNDGMDVSICRFEKKTDNKTEMIFAGAKNKMLLYIDQNKLLDIVSGDKFSLGGRFKPHIFINKTYLLDYKDTIILYTDGIIDQNNAERKRFGTKHFVKIISENITLPLDKLSQVLIAELEKYSQNQPPRDDITIVGLRI